MNTVERMKRFEMAAGDVVPVSMMEHLEEIGYFTAPSSIGYHGSYIGGLADHSLQVAMELANITNRMNLRWQRPQSPVVIGLLHDYIKAYDYEVTTDEHGQEIFEYSKSKPVPGHGEASVILLQQHMIMHGDMILTDEEMMCIRYHMGAFVDKKEWEYYSKAVARYPNILWTHTADMLASQVKGI